MKTQANPEHNFGSTPADLPVGEAMRKRNEAPPARETRNRVRVERQKEALKKQDQLFPAYKNVSPPSTPR